MKTTPDALKMLRALVDDGVDGAIVPRDVLRDVVEDLDRKLREERSWNARMRQLENARDDGRIAAEDSLIPMEGL